MSEQFKAGQKVKIIAGGWGIHPQHVGKIVTIREWLYSDSYSIVENLEGLGSNPFSQDGRTLRADGRSFESLPEAASVTEQIREINVLIQTSKDNVSRLQAEIAVEEATKARLNGKRQVLVATLLRELDV